MFWLALALLAAPSPTPARPIDAGNWISPGDYPAQALRYDQEGIVEFQLGVDRKGKVVRCSIIRSSGAPALDEQTCSLVRLRAHFEPARDAAGRPVEGAYSSRVRWVLPAAPRTPVRPWTQVSRLGIPGEVGVMSCRTDNYGEVPELIGDICRTTDEVPSEFLLLLRGGPGAAPVAVIVETSMNFEDMTPLGPPLETRAARIVSLQTSAFEIDEQGRVA